MFEIDSGPGTATLVLAGNASVSFRYELAQLPIRCMNKGMEELDKRRRHLVGAPCSLCRPRVHFISANVPPSAMEMSANANDSQAPYSSPGDRGYVVNGARGDKLCGNVPKRNVGGQGAQWAAVATSPPWRDCGASLLQEANPLYSNFLQPAMDEIVTHVRPG